FKNDVKLALARTVEHINDKEFAEFQTRMTPILDAAVNKNNTELRNIILQQIDTTGKQITSYSQTIIEEYIKAPVDFLGNDTLVFKKITGRTDFTKINKSTKEVDF